MSAKSHRDVGEFIFNRGGPAKNRERLSKFGPGPGVRGSDSGARTRTRITVPRVSHQDLERSAFQVEPPFPCPLSLYHAVLAVDRPEGLPAESNAWCQAWIERLKLELGTHQTASFRALTNRGRH